PGLMEILSATRLGCDAPRSLPVDAACPSPRRSIGGWLAILPLASIVGLAACGGGGRGGNAAPTSPARPAAEQGATSPGGSRQAAGGGRRLILIGLDAADERLIAAGIAKGNLPAFARM